MQQRFLLQILLLAQHVLGIIMPIIRSSRELYSGCCVWYFVLWFFSQVAGLVWSWGLCVRSKSHQITSNHSSTYTTKPAHNGTTQVRKLFYRCSRQVPFQTGTWKLEPRGCKTFHRRQVSVVTNFRLRQVSLYSQDVSSVADFVSAIFSTLSKMTAPHRGT